MEQDWERIASLDEPDLTNVMEGLGLLCAAREALPVDDLARHLHWEGKKPAIRFEQIARPFLLEQPSSWRLDRKKAWRPHHDGYRTFVLEALKDLSAELHQRLAAGIAAWPCVEERDAYYASRYALEHRSEAGDTRGAQALLHDVTYLEAFIQAEGWDVARVGLHTALERLPTESRELEALILRFLDSRLVSGSSASRGPGLYSPPTFFKPRPGCQVLGRLAKGVARLCGAGITTSHPLRPIAANARGSRGPGDRLRDQRRRRDGGLRFQ